MRYNAKLALFANVRGVAQPGSVLAWGARGRVFESHRPDQVNKRLHQKNQLRAGFCLFTSCLSRFYGKAVTPYLLNNSPAPSQVLYVALHLNARHLFYLIG